MGADSMRVATQRTLRTGTHKVYTCAFLKDAHEHLSPLFFYCFMSKSTGLTQLFVLIG